MPRRCPIRRIESASMPSSSSSFRAALTISRARGVSGSGALVAIASPKSIAERTVQRDVERPGERADEEPDREDAERGKRGECDRSLEAVGSVVQPHGSGWICLGARPRPAPGTVEEREVGGESERDDLSIPDHGEEEREGRH